MERDDGYYMRRGIERKIMQQKTVNSCKSFKGGGSIEVEWWWSCLFMSGDCHLFSLCQGR